MAHKVSNQSKQDSSEARELAKRLVSQQLRSLHQSGIESLPVPTGAHSFEWIWEASTSVTEANAPAPDDTTITATDRSLASSHVKETVQVTTADPTPAAKHVQPTVEPVSYQANALSREQRMEHLAVLKNEVASCTKCQELANCRKNTVFGVGNPQPELCFVGEGPGADEDRIGEPFVGKAGQLLDKIIGACKMSREEVYILNTVKCRPPGNRNPNEQELANCWPFAIQQLEILQPKFICCLGSVAARTLLKSTQSIGRMRGQFFKFRDSQVIVTYHPAYLLRNPAAKRQVWDDMKMLLAAMGRQI